MLVPASVSIKPGNSCVRKSNRSALHRLSSRARTRPDRRSHLQHVYITLMAGPVLCDLRVPIPESKVSSDRPPLFKFPLNLVPLNLVPIIGVLATGPVHLGEPRIPVPHGASVLHPGRISPGAGRVGIPAVREVTCCSPACGGGLPRPGFGTVNVSPIRMVADASPALGGGLPLFSAVIDSIVSNRSITGCVMVPGRCLPCPGCISLCISDVNWSFHDFADGIPAPKGFRFHSSSERRAYLYLSLRGCITNQFDLGSHHIVLSVGLLSAHLLASLFFLLTSLFWSPTTTFVGAPTAFQTRQLGRPRSPANRFRS